MGGAEIIAIVAIIVGAVTGLGGVRMGWRLQEQSTDKRALKAAQDQHARIATQCFLHLNGIQGTDNAFYRTGFHRMAEQAWNQRQQLASLAESFLLSLRDLPPQEFADSRRLWHQMIQLTYTDPMSAHAQGVPIDFAGPVIQAFMQRFPHLADLVAEQRQLQAADEQKALAAGEDQVKGAIREAVPRPEVLTVRLQHQFSASTDRGLAAVETLAESGTQMENVEVPVVLGVIGDVTSRSPLSLAERERLATAVRQVLQILPDTERAAALMNMLPRVGSALDLAALVCALPDSGLAEQDLGRLRAAIADHASEVSAHPWSLLSHGHLPIILAIWASVAEEDAVAWTHSRLDQPTLNEGLGLLQRCLVIDEQTGEPILDAKRLRTVLSPALVWDFLQRHAHARHPEIADMSLAMRATPPDWWSQ